MATWEFCYLLTCQTFIAYSRTSGKQALILILLSAIMCKVHSRVPICQLQLNISLFLKRISWWWRGLDWQLCKLKSCPSTEQARHSQTQDNFPLPAGCKRKHSGATEHLILSFSTETIKSGPTVAGHGGRFCGATSPLGNQPEKHQKLSQKRLSGEYVHLLPTWSGLECVT